MKCIKLAAYAKINLSLDVVAKRPDGYHDLAMLMQSIDLADELTIALNDSGVINVTTDCVELSGGPNNLAYRAAEHFNELFNLNSGYDIAIKKRIPIGAGLAGGSTDAAALIRGLLKLHDLAAERQVLIDLAKSIGADVPFCLFGGTALAEGIGERLTPIENSLSYWLVLVKPSESMSTADVFQHFSNDVSLKRPHNEKLISALQRAAIGDAIVHMGNVLESVTIKWLPQINVIKRQLIDLDADYVQMSGSGPTVFAIFKEESVARRAHARLTGNWQDVILARPTGCEEL